MAKKKRTKSREEKAGRRLLKKAAEPRRFRKLFVEFYVEVEHDADIEYVEEFIQEEIDRHIIDLVIVHDSYGLTTREVEE